MRRIHGITWETKIDNLGDGSASDTRGTTQVNDRFSLAIASTLRKDGTADEGAFDQSK
jgi:hypothetical protein